MKNGQNHAHLFDMAEDRLHDMFTTVLDLAPFQLSELAGHALCLAR
jgi:hypothetical protein